MVKFMFTNLLANCGSIYNNKNQLIKKSMKIEGIES